MPATQFIINDRELILARELVRQRSDLFNNDETRAQLLKTPRLITAVLPRTAYEFVCNGKVSANMSTNASVYIYIEVIESIKDKTIILQHGHKRPKTTQSRSSNKRAKLVAQSGSSSSEDIDREPSVDIVDDPTTEAAPIDFTSGFENLTFHSLGIQFRKNDSYVNATKLCKDGGKEWKAYRQNANSQAFIAELEGSVRKLTHPLIDQILNGPNQSRGTFVHPHIAINLAQWISPKFAVAVSELVTRYSKGDITTEESRHFAQTLASSSTPVTTEGTEDTTSAIHESTINTQHMIESLQKDISHSSELFEAKLQLQAAQAEVTLQAANARSDRLGDKAIADLQQAQFALERAQFEASIQNATSKLEIQDLKFHLEAAKTNRDVAMNNATSKSENQRMQDEMNSKETIARLTSEHAQKEQMRIVAANVAQGRIADLTLSREKAYHAADMANKDRTLLIALWKLRSKK